MDTNADAANQPVVNPEQTVAVKTFSGYGKVLNFYHFCTGKLETYTINDQFFYPMEQYCLGDNRLAVEYSPGKFVDIKKETVTDAKNAPVLLKVEQIMQSKIFLISYVPDNCSTLYDCGAGMPTHYVTHSFNADTLMYQVLHNFPGRGKPIWNNDGTKAVFIPDTCGGAGCDEDVLKGYSLDTDKVKDLTTEKASENINNDAVLKDKRIWRSVSWDYDKDHKQTNTITARILNPDGTEKEIKITF
jgi:hypothetical protein